ncbi:hypothetical protein FOPG_18537 [Fusarium oxysporum f. sp. conglutinans race 2 54008]|uniref:Uncharacterized protein n=1 Tax=Fusarium oxysporum f. sp. conglutinans race 2 54008 TaxID=1089457 RepID=X0GZH2_FUSOX|nr:hypothetical protein FOPG_18537 [Fusarium oxysporum f. sp. conglutinans race 2 54008]
METVSRGTSESGMASPSWLSQRSYAFNASSPSRPMETVSRGTSESGMASPSWLAEGLAHSSEPFAFQTQRHCQCGRMALHPTLTSASSRAPPAGIAGSDRLASRFSLGT